MIDKLIDGILSIAKNIQKIITSFFVIISIVASILYAGANKDVQSLRQAYNKHIDIIESNNKSLEESNINLKNLRKKLSKQSSEFKKTMEKIQSLEGTLNWQNDILLKKSKEIPIEKIVYVDKPVTIEKPTINPEPVVQKESKWGVYFGVNPPAVGANYRWGKLDLNLSLGEKGFGFSFSRKL